MNDRDFFRKACVQLTLSGERDRNTGILTIADEQHDAWPEAVYVNGQRFAFSEEEGDDKATGTTVDETEPENVRAFYDYDKDVNAD